MTQLFYIYGKSNVCLMQIVCKLYSGYILLNYIIHCFGFNQQVIQLEVLLSLLNNTPDCRHSNKMNTLPFSTAITLFIAYRILENPNHHQWYVLLKQSLEIMSKS